MIDRPRDQGGEIGSEYGDTMISTLRAIYGPSFAPNCQPTAMLSDVLAELDENTLRRLMHDYETGLLSDKLAEQA